MCLSPDVQRGWSVKLVVGHLDATFRERASVLAGRIACVTRWVRCRQVVAPIILGVVRSKFILAGVRGLESSPLPELRLRS